MTSPDADRSVPPLLGCDFTSSPGAKKTIVLAFGRMLGQRVQLLSWERFRSVSDWAQRLRQGDWVGGFDLPFGLPRAWVQAQAWPADWGDCLARYAATPREELRTRFQAYCDARPSGQKFAHRATDRLAGSSPSMKWVNPPVAWMMHAGVPVLRELGAWFPAHQPGAGQTGDGPRRIALEAYPGLLAREVLGRTSYKSDDPARQDEARLMARKTLVQALELGQTRLGLSLKLTPAHADGLVADATGDALDAVLCLMQAAWACQPERFCTGFGLPQGVDPLEGWIITA